MSLTLQEAREVSPGSKTSTSTMALGAAHRAHVNERPKMLLQRPIFVLIFFFHIPTLGFMRAISKIKYVMSTCICINFDSIAIYSSFNAF
jgi:hypothetical protein